METMVWWKAGGGKFKQRSRMETMVLWNAGGGKFK